ncbi:hypothetical protein JHK86_005000 [Glycine max]|nr:hypothetical protein JHK86_005000 [Glycine max]
MGDATSFNPFQALTFLILITTPFILGDDGTAATSSSPVISTGPYSYSDPFNLSMGVILAVLITTFCLTFLFLIYIKHCYDTNTNTLKLTTNSRPSHVRKNSGIDRDVLESLPVFRFGSLRGQKNGLDCAVCVARFEDPEVLRLLPKCKHAFHVARRILHVEPDDVVVFVKDDDARAKSPEGELDVDRKRPKRRRHGSNGLDDFVGRCGTLFLLQHLQRNNARDQLERIPFLDLKDSANRIKRRRGSHSQSTEESVRNEQDIDVVDDGVSKIRSANYMTLSFASDHNHHWSFMPVKPLPFKITDEMIDVTQRSNSPGGHSVEPASPSSSNVSLRKKMAPKEDIGEDRMNSSAGFGDASADGRLMVTWMKGVEEIGAFVASRGGFSFWDLLDLEKIPGKGWDCGKFL